MVYKKAQNLSRFREEVGGKEEEDRDQAWQETCELSAGVTL